MVENLSQQEIRVLELASKGQTDKGIGETLQISTSTVVTYWGRIRAKMGHQSRSELVANFVMSLAKTEVAGLRSELDQKSSEGEALSKDVERLKSLLEFAPEAMIIVNPEGEIQSGNHFAAELLECQESDFPGLSVSRFIPPEIHDAHREFRARYLQDPKRLAIGHDTGVEIVSYVGRRFIGFVTMNVAETPEGTAVIVMLRPLARTE